MRVEPCPRTRRSARRWNLSRKRDMRPEGLEIRSKTGARQLLAKAIRECRDVRLRPGHDTQQLRLLPVLDAIEDQSQRVTRVRGPNRRRQRHECGDALRRYGTQEGERDMKVCARHR